MDQHAPQPGIPPAPKRRRWRRVLRAAGGLVVLVALVLAIREVHAFLATPIEGSHVFTPFEGVRLPPVRRQTPDGTTFTVDPSHAIFGLDMGPEDDHSRRVFPSYAAALRHAKDAGLPTMPSVPLVLAAGRALDARVQTTVERLLEVGEQGRPRLLERWLAAVLARRADAAGPLRHAVDRAALHLATAIALGGGTPRLPADLTLPAPPTDITAQGPWGEADDLGRIWRRDRHLANALVVDDDRGAGAAALLARTLAADADLTAGWARQARVAQAFAGPAGGTTMEDLAGALTGIADADLAGPAACAAVRASIAAHPHPDGRRAVAPAAVAWVIAPEERILAPMGMAAWDDPIAALIDGITTRRIDLTPAADAGFYQRRWFALETLAAPRFAPETDKLQLTADYVRRWQRAFAAGFSEGRSGILKRLPVITLGSEEPGSVPADVAPLFTAEPAPVVYLRLARAYRHLATDLRTALGQAEWDALRDPGGASMAAAVDARVALLFGLTARTSAELGFPLAPAADLAVGDTAMAMAEAVRWAATAAEDADVQADARLLVPLAGDGDSYRCPAIIGVRLEPVVYRWVEEPRVDGRIIPRFVPARAWLPSPCPLVTTVATLPTPAAFRARCDGHEQVAELYATFGERPPDIRASRPPLRPWLVAVVVTAVLLVAVIVGWRRLGRRGRRWSMALTATVVVASAAVVTWAPPYPLVRWVATTVVMSNANIALMVQPRFDGWSSAHGERLLLDLISDPDPQVRYLPLWLPLKVDLKALGPAAQAVLRAQRDDPVDEVAAAAWFCRCRSPEPIASLLADLVATAEAKCLGGRLAELVRQRADDPALAATALTLADAVPDDRRTAVFSALAKWDTAPPAIRARARDALADPLPAVRRSAASMLLSHGAAEDLPLLVPLLRDAEHSVRITIFKGMMSRVDQPASADRPRWSAAQLQEALLGYAEDKSMTIAERLSAGACIADPQRQRALCRALLPLAEALPATSRTSREDDRHFTAEWAREHALVTLVSRWLTAGGMAGRETNREADSDEVLVDLGRDTELLSGLVDILRRGGDPAEALPVIGRALERIPWVALELIAGFGPRAAPLADKVIAMDGGFPQDGINDQYAIAQRQRHRLRILAGMGPTVTGRLTPILRTLVASPERKTADLARDLLTGKPVEPSGDLPFPPRMPPPRPGTAPPREGAGSP